MVQLLDLPPEIIQAICRALCPHCMNATNELVYASNALSYLSQTCSTMRTYAQPIFYHCPSPHEGDVVPLLRTLSTRPDLAEKARWLHMHDVWNADTLTPEDIGPFEALMANCQGVDGNPVKFSPEWHYDEENYPDDDLFASKPEAALSALLVALTPNLEVLKIVAGYFWQFPFCAPNSLLRLTELSLEHGDTESGVDAEAVRSIIYAAPNLEVFNGHIIRSFEIISHDNIVEVNLTRSVLTVGSFISLMEGLVKLRSFSYDSGGSLITDDSEATPREISDALHIRADTLQHVELCLADAFYYDDLTNRDLIVNLKELKQLTTFSVDSLAIYAKTGPDSTTNGSLIVDLLPQSIQSFCIDRPHKHITKDILKLSKLASSCLPDLESLHLPGMDVEDFGAVQTAFEGTGVSVFHR